MELLTLKTNRFGYLPLLICSGYLIVSVALLPAYMIWNTPLVIGLLMLPFFLQMEKAALSRRFLLPALVFSTLAIAVPVKSTLFFMLLFNALLLVETCIGKLSLAIPFTMVIISPIFKFFSDTLSFPLRLWLSSLVADTMTFAGMPVKSKGNLILLNGYEFYIDQACAGLNMLHISLLIALFLAVHVQKKAGKTLTIAQIAVVLSLTILLNLISNYFRIVMIVLFKIMPGQPLHDAAGLICLIIYVILPLMYCSPLILRKMPSDVFRSAEGKVLQLRYPVLHLFLLCTLGLLAFKPGANHNAQIAEHISLPGYHKSQVGEVIKLQDEHSLVYLKPTPFYAPEHNPMICWTGSGYEFSFINKERIRGTEVYTGILSKGKDKIHAAWWFDDGHMKTVNQLSWRTEAFFRNHTFYLVNVNASNARELRNITTQLLSSPFLLPE